MIIERRIKRNLRKNYLARKNDKILVLDSLSEFMIKDIIKTPIKLIKKSRAFFGIKEIDNNVFENKKLNSFIKKNKIRYAILAWTLDHETGFFIKNMSNNKKQKKHKNFIKLFKDVLEDELIGFCGFKKIKYKRMKKTKEKQMLDKLAGKYPEIKFSLLKSSDKIATYLN